MKALSTTGLTELITKIKTALAGKVDAVSGKGLSTNDYDATEKANVAANTTARHSHSNKAILDEIDDTTEVEPLSIEQGEEIAIESADTISIDATPTASSTNLVTSGGVKTYVDGHHDNTKQDVIDAQHKLSYNLLSDTPTVPTKTSDLTNDSGFLTSHQDISGKEDKSNKTTSLSASSTDDEYPSAKCVYDIVGDIESTLQAIRGVWA